jgi:hypothetical protein
MRHDVSGAPIRSLSASVKGILPKAGKSHDGTSTFLNGTKHTELDQHRCRAKAENILVTYRAHPGAKILVVPVPLKMKRDQKNIKNKK